MSRRVSSRSALLSRKRRPKYTASRHETHGHLIDLFKTEPLMNEQAVHVLTPDDVACFVHAFELLDDIGALQFDSDQKQNSDIGTWSEPPRGLDPKTTVTLAHGQKKLTSSTQSISENRGMSTFLNALQCSPMKFVLASLALKSNWNQVTSRIRSRNCTCSSKRPPTRKLRVIEISTNNVQQILMRQKLVQLLQLKCDNSTSKFPCWSFSDCRYTNRV